MSNDDRAALIILFLCSTAMWVYVFLNPAEVKKANEAERFRRFGFGSKPVWFFRLLGFLGILIGILVFYSAVIKRA